MKGYFRPLTLLKWEDSSYYFGVLLLALIERTYNKMTSQQPLGTRALLNEALFQATAPQSYYYNAPRQQYQKPELYQQHQPVLQYQNQRQHQTSLHEDRQPDVNQQYIGLHHEHDSLLPIHQLQNQPGSHIHQQAMHHQTGLPQQQMGSHQHQYTGVHHHQQRYPLLHRFSSQPALVDVSHQILYNNAPNHNTVPQTVSPVHESSNPNIRLAKDGDATNERQSSSNDTAPAGQSRCTKTSTPRENSYTSEQQSNLLMYMSSLLSIEAVEEGRHPLNYDIANPSTKLILTLSPQL